MLDDFGDLSRVVFVDIGLQVKRANFKPRGGDLIALMLRIDLLWSAEFILKRTFM
jgi:hypothetical protein